MGCHCHVLFPQVRSNARCANQLLGAAQACRQTHIIHGAPRVSQSYHTLAQLSAAASNSTALRHTNINDHAQPRAFAAGALPQRAQRLVQLVDRARAGTDGRWSGRRAPQRSGRLQLAPHAPLGAQHGQHAPEAHRVQLPARRQSLLLHTLLGQHAAKFLH